MQAWWVGKRAVYTDARTWTGNTSVLDSSLSLGPSPRGRGNLEKMHPPFVVVGSIPAWAGKPGSVARMANRFTVHPRVGGETMGTCLAIVFFQGPSPRGRGNRDLRGSPAPEVGSIPAWAGKPPIHGDEGAGIRVHPRVGGETRSGVWAASSIRGPSPRGRGNRKQVPPGRMGPGSIPAWAGKPPDSLAFAYVDAVHPRVGGETASE